MKYTDSGYLKKVVYNPEALQKIYRIFLSSQGQRLRSEVSGANRCNYCTVCNRHVDKMVHYKAVIYKFHIIEQVKHIAVIINIKEI